MPSDQAVAAPSEEDLAKARYDAALQDQAEEQERVEAANERYADEQLTGAVPRRYIVSFSDAVGVADVLEGISEDPSIVLHQTFIWMRGTGSNNPITGSNEVPAIGWSPATENSEIREQVDGFLRSHLDGINKLIAKLPLGTIDPNLVQQKSEIEALLLSLGGIELFGIDCTCSPDSIDRLASEVPPIELRAVELAEDAENPIWPADPLRTRVIESGGSYGL